MKYRVVQITKSVERYPECATDTAEFPDLVKYVDDEMDLFVVDEIGHFWPAHEFFYMQTLTHFTAGACL
jgi:hypothetical protein